jgi:purine-binding chemotaxis protein CheW
MNTLQKNYAATDSMQIDNSALLGLDNSNEGEQHLSFILGEEHYAVDILSVSEIRGWENPTKVPNTPDYMKGVINLRGIIVPVFDLRIRFEVGVAEYSATTVVVVLKLMSGTQRKIVGFIVDAVSDVLNIPEKNIVKAPAFGGNLPTHYIKGLVNIGNNVVTVLSLEALLNIEDQ